MNPKDLPVSSDGAVEPPQGTPGSLGAPEGPDVVRVPVVRICKEDQVSLGQLLMEAGALQVKSNADAAIVAQFIVKVRAAKVELTAKYDEQRAGLYKLHGSAVGIVKEFVDPFNKMEEVGKAMIRDWGRQTRAEQAARLLVVAQSRAQEEQNVQIATLRAQGKSEEADALVNAPLDVVQMTTGAQLPAIKGVVYVRRFKAIIDHPDLVPHELCLPDKKAIQARVDSLKTRANIPGVRVEEEITVTIRGDKDDGKHA